MFKRIEKVDDFIVSFDDESQTIIKQIGQNACDSQCVVTKIDMSKTKIEIIQDKAFTYVDSLSEVIFPDSLTSIGFNSFLRTSLVNIRIPAKVCSMTGSAWSQIFSILSFDVDTQNRLFYSENGGLFNIGKTKLIRATNNITSCSQIPYFDSLTAIGEFALTAVPIDTFIATKQLTTVEYASFHFIRTVSTIDFTDANITSLPTDFFWENSATIFRCPVILEEIEKSAFHSISLKNVFINPSIEIIHEQAFYNCSNLRRIFYYGSKNFSHINMFGGTTRVENINVFTTVFYQYYDFGQITIQRIRHFPTCIIYCSIPSRILTSLFISIFIY